MTNGKNFAAAKAAFDLETFTFNGKTLRTISVDGTIWFPNADIARVIGLDASSITANVKDLLTDDERVVLNSKTLRKQGKVLTERELDVLFGGTRGRVAATTESGLYKIVLRAQRSNPAVRGEEAFDVTTEAGLAAATMHVMAALQAKADGFKAMYEAAKPKADAFQVIAEAEGALTITDAAKALKAKPKNLFAFLEAKKLVTKGPNRQATVSAQKRGIMDVRTSTDPRGRIRTSPVVTPKGLAYLADAKANFEAKRAA